MLTLMLNPTGEDRGFTLPEPRSPTRMLLDTAEPDAAARAIAHDEPVLVPAHSAVLVDSDAIEGASTEADPVETGASEASP